MDRVVHRESSREVGRQGGCRWNNQLGSLKREGGGGGSGWRGSQSDGEWGGGAGGRIVRDRPRN